MYAKLHDHRDVKATNKLRIRKPQCEERRMLLKNKLPCKFQDSSIQFHADLGHRKKVIAFLPVHDEGKILRDEGAESTGRPVSKQATTVISFSASTHT